MSAEGRFFVSSTCSEFTLVGIALQSDDWWLRNDVIVNELGRNSTAIELVAEYVTLIEERCNAVRNAPSSGHFRRSAGFDDRQLEQLPQ